MSSGRNPRSRSSSSSDDDSVDSNENKPNKTSSSSSSRRSGRRRHSIDADEVIGGEQPQRSSRSSRRGTSSSDEDGGAAKPSSGSRSSRKNRGSGGSSKPSSSNSSGGGDGGGEDLAPPPPSDDAANTSTVSSRVSIFEEHISKSHSSGGGGDDHTVSSRVSARSSSSNKKGSSSASSNKKKQQQPASSEGGAADTAFSPGGFGGFPSTFSSPAASAPKKGAASTSAAAEAFGNFEDMAAFSPSGHSTGGVKAAGKMDAAAFSSTSAAAFDAAFATDPKLFEAAITESSAFGSTADFFDPANFDAAAFDAAPAFSGGKQAAETVWDKSPLTDVPKVEPEKLVLRQKSVLTKTFHGTPVNNPLNGNIIFAAATTSSKGGVYLHEIDPSRNFIQVAAAPILTADMRDKIAAKYSATVCAVEGVRSLACGVQTTAGRQTRVRVAAIVDLKVLEAPGTMRVVAVWQWSNLQQLMYVMTPPAGGDFTYDLTTLQVSDGLCFLAGSSPKGACVFVSKPAVREAWSANFLTGSGTVSAMSVAPNLPYLVVALTDRSVTVWTYKSALVRDSAAKAQTTSKRWLYPLCRLSHAKAMAAEKPASPGPDYKESTVGKEDAGRCTHFAWLLSDSSHLSLQLLAVGFENGFAVFHVELPVLADGFKPVPDPTQSTVVSATPSLAPIAAKRWLGEFECTFVSWLCLGPYVDPLIAVLLIDATRASVLLCSMNIPAYDKKLLAKARTLHCRILTSKAISKGSTSFPGGMLQSCSASKVLVCYSEERLSTMSLASSTRGLSPVASLDFPVTSCPPGLSSVGDPFLVDATSDKDGILNIFSTVQCERQRGNSDASSLVPWSVPMRRFWLCRSVVGDTRETFVEETKEERGFGDNEEVSGGASTEIICELDHDSLRGMSPVKIVRCTGRSVCAILFRPAFASSRSLSLVDAGIIAFVNFQDQDTVIAIIEGRDVCFFPSEDAESGQGLILSADGSALAFFDWNSSGICDLKTTFRPIVGVDSDKKDYVECKRIDLFADGSKLALAVLGRRARDDRFCFVAGDVCDLTDARAESWSKLLPNIVSGRSAWLDEKENVLSIVGLQGDGSGYRNFALATSTRVIILSSALTVAAESRRRVTSGNLAPLGSFAVCFSSEAKVCYLCCLDGDFSGSGIASLRQKCCSALIAVRPDRLILSPFPSSSSLPEPGNSPDAFVLPAPNTRPALLLEPMVANAICVGGKQKQSTQVLRSVIEKFGRKVASLTHGEKEGIGQSGAGLSSRTFDMLNNYGLKHAASWLLTGTVNFERSANCEILPAWLPVIAKSKGAMNSDAMLHLLSNGDSYLSEYVKSPEHNMPSQLPRQSDATAYICAEYAQAALKSGNALDALKMFDLSGAESTDSSILLLSLLLEKGKSRSNNATGVLDSLSGLSGSGLSRLSGSEKIPSSLAALAASLKKGQGSSGHSMAADAVDRWIKPLAPSLQRSKNTDRLRQRLLFEKDLESAGGKQVKDSDPFWMTPCNESRHVWNEGPRKEKENLLLLDSVEDWLGRRRPLILGREGASAAKDRGEKTLADILNQDDDSFGGKDDELESVLDDGWVDGIGEGRSDEANLSAYFRMSEGDADDSSSWRTEGLLDLSPYQNRAVIVGDPNTVTLEQSTSSVDEGEPGKVKSLFDLVFAKSGVGIASGLALPAPRGGSLDVGLLHGPGRESRKRCSIEFWYYLPAADSMTKELVLARRTMGSVGDDLAKVGRASDKDSVLWELSLRKTGELQFRSCGGTSLLSSQSRADSDDDDDDDSENEKERADLALFERWNHVCIVLSSKHLSVSECSVSIYMKGVEVISSCKTSMLPAGLAEKDLRSDAKLADIKNKSYLLFGLNHSPGFRMTELRVWACERSSEDTSMFLYEYLNAAEQKKKFKVKISNKNKKGAALGRGLGLAPPARTMSARTGSLAPQKDTGIVSLAPQFSLAPPKPSAERDAKPESVTSPSKPSPPDQAIPGGSAFGASFSAFGATTDFSAASAAAPQESLPVVNEDTDELNENENDGIEEADETDEDVAGTLWDSAIPLSQQIRASAATALIRGPPATRHYGGNRGGLPDYSGVDRFGVGGIAICGSEKTIVFRDNEDPPGLTYPIGASGAVVSDQMDDEGSEFLCCFLAKEGRMVVFELRSRTVVVELQMTTKLNFWRYLPPEAAENTLCFMLVTPVGGFHWMPLEESPRPHQVWKRGPELQGKKVVCYEEGGSNGLDDADILSRVGLVTALGSSSGGSLEGWLIPISGDSQAQQVPGDMLGACLCQPVLVEDGPFLPLVVTVHTMKNGTWVNVISIVEPESGSIALGDVVASQLIDESESSGTEYDPPAMAMGASPEVLCVSLSNIVVVILRRKGLVAAFELEEDDELNLIAQENVDHYIIDAVMRYSEEVGGAEIVMLLSDSENPKDGRIVSFCFRSAI